jgi:hypothetical protein
MLVKIDAIPDAARVPSQEFVVPNLGSCRELFQAQGVAEAAGHVILGDLADASFEVFHSGMAARQQEE